MTCHLWAASDLLLPNSRTRAVGGRARHGDLPPGGLEY